MQQTDNENLKSFGKLVKKIGIEEGEKVGREKVALTMLNAGDPIELVSIRTGISVDDIFKLQHAQAVI